MTYLHPDLHLHTNCSDGSDTPLELIEKIRKSSIDIFSITDHDAYKGCLEISKYLKADDPFFIYGIEFSCEDEFGDYHILAYCYDINNQNIIDTVEKTHAARVKKAENRIHFLEENYNFSFTKEEISKFLQNPNPGKPHLAQLLVDKGYIKERQEAYPMLNEYKGSEFKLTPKEAIEIILDANGIPVLAHGILGNGKSNFTKEEIENRVSRLKDFGLLGLECFYSTYTKEQQQIMLSLAKKYNLLVTAGSDYHGTNKIIDLGDSKVQDIDIMDSFYQAIQTRIKEEQK